MQASASCWRGSGSTDAAVAEFEKAVALNPNFTDWRMAIALVYAGQSERAVEVLKAHMRLDPFYVPLAPHWLGLAHFTLGNIPRRWQR